MSHYVREEVICRLIKATDKDHCRSCHSDEDGGMEIELGKERWTNMCCGIHAKYKEYVLRKANMVKK